MICRREKGEVMVYRMERRTDGSVLFSEIGEGELIGGARKGIERGCI